MSKVSEKMKDDLEYGILNVDLDIKLFRTKLLRNTDDEVGKLLEQKIAELEGGKQLLEDKLAILEAKK